MYSGFQLPCLIMPRIMNAKSQRGLGKSSVYKGPTQKVKKHRLLALPWMRLLCNFMPLKSIFWLFKFGTKISIMRWRWRAPLPAAIIFTIIENGFFTLRAISCYFILKEFDKISAILTFYIENCVYTPFLRIISCTFSHIFNSIIQVLFVFVKFELNMIIKQILGKNIARLGDI